mgnify:CR=1 FL=1
MPKMVTWLPSDIIRMVTREAEVRGVTTDDLIIQALATWAGTVDLIKDEPEPEPVEETVIVLEESESDEDDDDSDPEPEED